MTHPNNWRATPDSGRDRGPAGPHEDADQQAETQPTEDSTAEWTTPHHSAQAASAASTPALDALADPGQTQPGMPAIRTEPTNTLTAHPAPLQIHPPSSGPLDHPPHAAGAASQAPGSLWRSAKRRAGVKLLIVENEYSNLRLMEHILGLAGYECVTASNGREALAVFERERPDLVLTDIAMPVMDGLEATAALRARPDGARIPIIGVSAFAMPGDRERALYGGCNAYVTKPYRPQDLLEIVERLLEA